MKLIIATFKIENDLQEFKLVKYLEGLGGKISIKPFNEHLDKDDKYKALKKAKRDAEDAYYNFLNDNRTIKN